MTIWSQLLPVVDIKRRQRHKNNINVTQVGHKREKTFYRIGPPVLMQVTRPIWTQTRERAPLPSTRILPIPIARPIPQVTTVVTAIPQCSRVASDFDPI